MAGQPINRTSLQALYDAALETQKALKPASERLPKLAHALRQLSGVAQGKARAYLRRLRNQIDNEVLRQFDTGDSDDVAHIEVLPGLVLTSANMADLFFEEDLGAARLTPRGASILLKLYDAGLLPTDSKRASGGEPSALRQFAESEEYLIATAAKNAEARAAEAEARNRLLADPAGVSEAQFDYGLLNDIFVARFGRFHGSMTMDVGGIAVTKDVRVYTSISGKRRDSAVTFSWTGSDGQPHTLEKQSRYANNRRNDPARNWGLPE